MTRERTMTQHRDPPVGNEAWKLAELELGAGFKLEFTALREAWKAGSLRTLVWKGAGMPSGGLEALLETPADESFRGRRPRSSYRYYADGGSTEEEDFGKDGEMAVRELSPRAPGSGSWLVSAVTTRVAHTLRQVALCGDDLNVSTLHASYPCQLSSRIDEATGLLCFECFEYRPAPLTKRALDWAAVTEFCESRAYRIAFAVETVRAARLCVADALADTEVFGPQLPTPASSTLDDDDAGEPLATLVLELSEALDADKSFAVRRVRPKQRFDGAWITCGDWTPAESATRASRCYIVAEARELRDMASALCAAGRASAFNQRIDPKLSCAPPLPKKRQKDTASTASLRNACLARAVREGRVDPDDPEDVYYLGDCSECGWRLDCRVTDRPEAIVCPRCCADRGGLPPDATPPDLDAWNGRPTQAETKQACLDLSNVENEYVRETYRAQLARALNLSPPVPITSATHPFKDQNTPAQPGPPHNSDDVADDVEIAPPRLTDACERELLRNWGLETVPTRAAAADFAVKLLSTNTHDEVPSLPAHIEELRDMVEATLDMRDAVRRDALRVRPPLPPKAQPHVETPPTKPLLEPLDGSCGDFEDCPAAMLAELRDVRPGPDDDFNIPDSILLDVQSISLGDVAEAFDFDHETKLGAADT